MTVMLMLMTVLLVEASFASAFLPHARSRGRTMSLSSAVFAARQRSRVQDEDGPTPAAPDDAPELIDPADIPELHYDKNSHPIPHQPWRRGTTEGCEDPIEAPWRQEAELTIKKAARMVGGSVVDVTWYLTQLVITVDDDSLEDVDEYSMGPEIMVAPDDGGPEFFDPQDPNPEPIWADEEEYLYERDDDMEEMLKKNMYAKKDDDDEEEDDLPPENPVKLYAQKETREDMAAMSQEEEARLENEERPVDSYIFELNTPALSTMARAILDALEQVEDSLHVLERHEVILSSPGAPNILETQSQFDAHRGSHVIVETQDPFNSNRVLKGKLLTRNSMDLVINKMGRMVTIPLNFVKCVRLPSSTRGAESWSLEVQDD
jgi:ribosome maturation factor RimP